MPTPFPYLDARADGGLDRVAYSADVVLQQRSPEDRRLEDRLKAAFDVVDRVFTELERRVTAAGGGGSTLQQGAVLAAHTGDLTETTLMTVPVPPGAMGADGRLDVDVILTCSNTLGDKIVRIRFGGVVIAAFYVADTPGADIGVRVHNMGDEASQRSAPRHASVVGHIASTTSSVDTLAGADVTVTVQLTDVSDTATVAAASVVIYPGA